MQKTKKKNRKIDKSQIRLFIYFFRCEQVNNFREIDFLTGSFPIDTTAKLLML